MRFLADENISSAVIERLEALGHEVLSIGRIAPGSVDRDVLALAQREACILVTEDRDFGEMVVRQQLTVSGILLLELDRLSNEAEAQRVVDVVTANVDKLSRQLLVLEPSRIRMRPLKT
jgi:predicted nuclease of predicted toxin-antitoxin system